MYNSQPGSVTLISHIITSVALSAYPALQNNATELFIQLRANLSEAVSDGKLLADFVARSSLTFVSFDGKMTSINLEVFSSPSYSPTSLTVVADTSVGSVGAKTQNNTLTIAVAVVASIVGLVALIIMFIMMRKYWFSRRFKGEIITSKTIDEINRASKNVLKSKPSMSRLDTDMFVDLAGLQEKITSSDSIQYELDQTRVMLDATNRTGKQ